MPAPPWRRRDDHDPAALEALADRLLAAARHLEASVLRESHAVRDAARRLGLEARTAAALLQRLAADLRLVETFLRDAALLAPGPDEPT